MFAFLIEIVLVPYTSCRQKLNEEHIININSILEDYTKGLEQAIDAIWVINIILSFLTPFEKDIGYNDKFIEIAWHYKWRFILDMLSTLYLFLNYNIEYRWMYYLKFLRFYYFPRAFSIMHRVIDDIVRRCNVSKQTRSNIQSLLSQLIAMLTTMHVIACGWILFGEHPEWGSWIQNP